MNVNRPRLLVFLGYFLAIQGGLFASGAIVGMIEEGPFAPTGYLIGIALTLIGAGLVPIIASRWLGGMQRIGVFIFAAIGIAIGLAKGLTGSV